jgi:hypothetical protein
MQGSSKLVAPAASRKHRRQIAGRGDCSRDERLLEEQGSSTAER